MSIKRWARDICIGLLLAHVAIGIGIYIGVRIAYRNYQVCFAALEGATLIEKDTVCWPMTNNFNNVVPPRPKKVRSTVST